MPRIIEAANPGSARAGIVGDPSGPGITTEQADVSIDELGPVDWIVVELPGSRFTGEIAPALNDLVDRGIDRVLDLLMMRKSPEGTLDGYEISDLDESEIGELRAYETALATLLSEEGVEAVAAAVEPGSTAAVLVWENSWAAPSGPQCAVPAVSEWRADGSRPRRCSARWRKT